MTVEEFEALLKLGWFPDSPEPRKRLLGAYRAVCAERDAANARTAELAAEMVPRATFEILKKSRDVLWQQTADEIDKRKAAEQRVRELHEAIVARYEWQDGEALAKAQAEIERLRLTLQHIAMWQNLSPEGYQDLAAQTLEARHAD